MQRRTAQDAHPDLLEQRLALVRRHRPQRPIRDPRHQRRVPPLHDPEAQIQRDERPALPVQLVGRSRQAHLPERRLVGARVHALKAPRLSAHRHLRRRRVGDIERFSHQPPSELVYQLLNVAFHLQSDRPDGAAATATPCDRLLYRFPKLGHSATDRILPTLKPRLRRALVHDENQPRPDPRPQRLPLSRSLHTRNVFRSCDQLMPVLDRDPVLALRVGLVGDPSRRPVCGEGVQAGAEGVAHRSSIVERLVLARPSPT